MLVHSVNMIKKNTKVTTRAAWCQGRRHHAHQEAPIHVSNVQLIDPETKQPTRVGYKRGDDGQEGRGSPRASGKEI